jgi:hypothetical protein
LQAGGHRFESGCLQSPVRRSGDGREADRRVTKHEAGLARSLVFTTVTRGKVTRSWRCSSLRGDPHRPVNRHIDDFVLCQGKSGSGASLGACDGSEALSRVRPVVRLMSDRESVSGVQRPCLGFAAGRAPLNRTARVQRRLCELIRMAFILLKEWMAIRVLCRDD